ncbi:tetratricopeptide repeat protein [Sphingomonas floccifaciens]|uniref:Tetratricopeptide repeat protein n=1 Tax=Sphingomonas floccifaciens TaxID=1844115 RepID=A0ABW4NHE6_9SPHN
MRLVLAVAAAVLGYYSVTFSIAQVVVTSDPELAFRLAPYDGRITAALSEALSGEGATPQDRARAERLAKQALRQDPTAVAAAATLGIIADGRGDKAAARRYFTYAQKLSRRDLRTQLWMIEDAVERGDLPGAVRQYDITLRVFPTMGELLYPVMAAASDDPLIRVELVKTLAAKPLWGENFITFVSGNGVDPQSTAALFTALRRANVPVPESARAGAINSLIAAGQIDAAWSYYAAVHPGADRRRARDPKFAQATESPSQLDWTPINDGSGLTTSIQGGIFDFAAPASVGGPMLQQLQLLPPGSYRLTGHSTGIEQAAGALPYWTLRCQDGRELGRVEVPNSGVAGGNFSGTFSIPAGCPVQTLLLMARPSDAVSGLSGQLDRVELAPAR